MSVYLVYSEANLQLQNSMLYTKQSLITHCTYLSQFILNKETVYLIQFNLPTLD